MYKLCTNRINNNAKIFVTFDVFSAVYFKNSKTEIYIGEDGEQWANYKQVCRQHFLFFLEIIMIFKKYKIL